MIFRIRLLLLLSLFFIIPLPMAHSAPLTSPGVAAQLTDGLEVLPGGCGGGLPFNGTQVCCVSGYVFLDGAPVAGAKVTVTNPNTNPPRSVIVVSKDGPDSRFPYYHVDLNSDLHVQPNDQISIHVEYEGRIRDMSHNTLAGGQQVDVVLPRADTPEDYTFQETLGSQGEGKDLRMPVGVAVDRTGSIYVADYETFSIQVFNSDGLFLRRWGTRGTKPGQFGPMGGIVLDAQGNVYLAHGNISKFSSTGALLDEWGARPNFGPDGVFDNATAVAVDSAGVLYGVGDSGNGGWLRKRTPDGAWARINVRNGAGAMTFSFPAGVAADSVGNIYVADTFNNRVLKFAPDGLLLTLWGGSAGNAVGAFNQPRRLSVDTANNLYLADSGNHRIQKLNIATGTWSIFAGTGSSGSTTGQFSNPYGVTVAPSGDIYVADTNNRRVQKIASSNPQQIAVAVPVGQLSPGQLTGPGGIAVDNNGNIYIADKSNSRLQRFSPGAQPHVLVEGRGIGIGQFNAINGVAVDKSRNIYTTDLGTSSNRVQKFDSNGTPITQWYGTETIGAHPPAGALNTPYAIAVDTNAVPPTIYVIDQGNHRIVKFTSDGGFLWSRTGPDLGLTAFTALGGIAVAPDGAVFVSDTTNNRLVKLTSDGALAEQPWGGPTDPSRAILSPAGLSVDLFGNIYVMTAGDQQLLKFSADGTLRAAWSAHGYDEGYVYGNFLAVDSQGLVYYSDEQNNRIQIFRPIGPHRPPVATITQVRTQTVISPVTIQSGEQLYLHGLGGTDSTIAQSLSYEWKDNGVLLSTTQSPIVSFNTKGLHTISLQVRDASSVPSASVTTSITVADPIPATKWTMMLYLDGDNAGTASLAGTLIDLKREIAENPNSAVSVVAIYDGPNSDDSSYYVQQGNTLVEQKLGEVDMGDPETLVNLVTWAKRDAPAKYYYLAIADHANGLDGIAWDNHPGAGATTDHLDNGKLRRALEQSRQILGQPIDVLHLDGCLMGLIENAYQVHNLANFEVSSENLAWSAFAYADYRAQIDASTTPMELAEKVADRYQAQVQGLPYTIAALDLGQVANVTTKINALADALRQYAQLSQAHRDQLLAIRNQAQKFDSNGNYALESTDLYIDLDHWAQLIVDGVDDAAVHNAATALRTALTTLVIAQHEHHGSGSINGIPVSLEHARGIAIYYPFQPTATSQAKYTNGDLDFVRDSAWDTFLAAGLDPLSPDQTAPQADPIAPLTLRTGVYLPLVMR